MSTLRVSIEDMVSLKVRARGRGKKELPAVLYQCLPERAMSLFATIPCGAFAVSIPGNSAPGSGCPILKAVPPAADGFVVVYDRAPNGRYEAATVRYRDKSFALADFIPFARRRMGESVGILKAIPGRYAYVAPTREEWGVILRDNGYVAWDPSGMPCDADPEHVANLRAQGSSGILARVPVFAGDKRPREDVLPVFARVEATFDSNPGPGSDWIGFAEYQRVRASRTCPPESTLSGFREWLRRLTEECGFKCWVLCPGMLFGDRQEWWGERSRRRTEHEGVDFATGLLPNGETGNIPGGVPVRSLADGDVVAVLDDFIGKTVVVRHSAISREDGDVFYTCLSHIQPRVRPADSVAGGQIVGTTGKSTGTSAPSHIHLTGAWIPKTLVPSEIRMDHVHPGFVPVALVDFMNELRGNPLCSLCPLEGGPAK